MAIKIKMEEEGFDLVIKKLNELTDIGFKECAREPLKKVAEEVYHDMWSKAPMSTERDIHGIDAIGKSKMRMSKNGYNFYISVGISQTIQGGGSGADYWEQIRGLWFQEWKIDEPNYGWYTRAVLNNKDSYKKHLEDDFLMRVRRYFNILK